MKTMLRNLAANWADTRFSKANDVLRHKLIRAEAAEQRLKQEKARLSNALRSYGQLVEACRQMREQAEHERDVALARQTELEEALVAVHTQRDAAAGLSSAWDGVVAAGLAESVPQCPEGLLLDGVELHRCIRDGGHDGNHWNRGHEREWPRIEVDETCEVPW